MKILCVEYDPETDPLDPGPVSTFPRHKVTLAASFMQAHTLAQVASNGGGPFAAALIDCLIPACPGERLENLGMVLASQLLEFGIKACYILLPLNEHECRILSFDDREQIIVSTSGCWKPNGRRDRVKMLKILKFRFEEMCGKKLV
jgi:hypothetical protein